MSLQVKFSWCCPLLTSFFYLHFREVEQEIAAKLQELKLMNFEDKEDTMLENIR
jgi:hypothetical protein